MAAIDFNALRNRQKSLARKTSDSLWKPEEGDNTIRIVPYAHLAEDAPQTPFIEAYFNYEVAKKSMLSPKTFGKPCPVDEFATTLKNTRDQDDYNTGRKIEPKLRIFAPVIVRGKEKEGVKFWSFGKQVYEQLIEIFLDEDYGDISDPKSGRDVKVTYKPAVGNEYPSTSIRVKPNKTVVTEDQELLVKIAKEQPNLFEDVYTEPSYEEVKTLLQNYLSGGDPTDTASDEASDQTIVHDDKGPSFDASSVEDSFAVLFKTGKTS